MSGRVALAFAALAWACCHRPAAAGPEPEPGQDPPNVLFILTDDQGWPTLGCYGNKHVATPNLDRLASQGVRFADAYVTPQCTPTRASLLTGQHSARNGMWHVIPWYGYPWAPLREPAFVEKLGRDTFTLADGLKAAGYATACIGKWHLTRDGDGDYNALNPDAAPRYGFDFAAPPAPPSAFEEGGDRGVDHLTDQTIAFIERNRDRPFFCYLAHHMIHGKVVAPRDLVQEYLDRGYPETGMFNATYLAGLDHLDRSVGRLMACLDELGLAERTVVVFLSDNGGIDERFSAVPTPPEGNEPTRLEVDLREFDNAPLRAGKGSPYEGGIRVPCIVRWPGVAEAGSTCRTPVHVVDWMPTLFELSGAQAPADHPVDGESLVPLLRGDDALADRPLFWHFPLYELRWGVTPCAVVRRGDHKLIEYFGDRFDEDGRYRPGHHVELYNLIDDPGERHDLADREPRLADDLRNLLRPWLGSMSAEIPGPNPHHDPSRPFLEAREKPLHLR